jgi:hypothetical protein
MSDSSSSHETLKAWLSLTRPEEIDCDAFNELLAPWLDQRITDPKLLALLEHHRQLCAECHEEATLVESAIAEEP